MASYVLITAAHNEEAFIAKTCESVIRQTQPPIRWFIVDDASTDRTASIAEHYRGLHPDFIEVLRVRRPPGRDFGNKVRAFDIGLARARLMEFDYIGNLDADISFDENYYSEILSRFSDNTKLGLGGGMVHSHIGKSYVTQNVSLDSVAGAVQLFRRQCFNDVGGYRPLKQGGIDAAAEIIARKAGWGVRTFPDLRVLEHRRTGTATARPLQARRREGMRLYSLGYSFPFFLLRCLRRSTESPMIVGSLAALYGYLVSALTREPIALPPDVVAFLRGEQRQKVLHLIGLGRAGRE